MKTLLCALLAASQLISQINIASQTVAEQLEIIRGYKTEAEARISDESAEMRGVWVATVRNVDYPVTEGTTDSEILRQQADEIIATCEKLGMNNIFFQVRPTCDALYKSEIFPWSRYLTGAQGVAPDNDFDPLDYWVKQCHARGIKIHAWVNPYRVTRDNDDVDTEWNTLICDSNPAKQHPEWLIRHKDNNYYFDPGIPEVRQLVLDGIKEIVENYDVDGIHFDDYFYPNETQGWVDDDKTFAQYGTIYGEGLSKAQWRRENVNQLVMAINPLIKDIDPDCTFGISPSGIWANKSTTNAGSNTSGMEHYTTLYADSRKWIAEEWIDYVVPQIYWQIGYEKADYKTLLYWWAKQVEGTNVKLYIGMADYRVDSYGLDMIKRELELNDTVEVVSGEVHYNYTSLKNSTSLTNLYTDLYK